MKANHNDNKSLSSLIIRPFSQSSFVSKPDESGNKNWWIFLVL